MVIRCGTCGQEIGEEFSESHLSAAALVNWMELLWSLQSERDKLEGWEVRPMWGVLSDKMARAEIEMRKAAS